LFFKQPELDVVAVVAAGFAAFFVTQDGWLLVFGLRENVVLVGVGGGVVPDALALQLAETLLQVAAAFEFFFLHV